MNRFNLIEIEWNCYNGITASILHIEYNDMDSALLGINVSKMFCYIDILFITIKIFDKNENTNP